MRVSPALLFFVVALIGVAVQTIGFLLAAALATVPAPVNRLSRLEKRVLLATSLPFLALLLATAVPALDPRVWPPVLVPVTLLLFLVAALLVLFFPPLAVLRQRKAGWARFSFSVPVYLGLVGVLVVLGFESQGSDAARFAQERKTFSNWCQELGARLLAASGDAKDPIVEELLKEAGSAEETLLAVAAESGPTLALRDLRVKRQRLQAKLSAVAQGELASLPEALGEDGAAKKKPRVARRPDATCARVNPGMSAAEVRTVLGAPDETRSMEDLRGPGAERWAYRDFLCQVHLQDGVVEFVD